MFTFSDNKSDEKKSSNMILNTIVADLFDDSSKYILKIDCPGLSLDEIKLKWVGDALSVRFTPNEVDEDGMYEIFRERLCEEVERKFNFPNPVQKQSIDAEIGDGILVVTVDQINEDDDDNLITISKKK